MFNLSKRFFSLTFLLVSILPPGSLPIKKFVITFKYNEMKICNKT